MSSKSIGVAFKPLTQPENTQINAPTNIDKPDYDDVGVSYKGYSKTILSGNQFRLNPQTLVDANFYAVYTGGETSSTCVLSTIPTGKIFYMTKLVFQIYKGAGITLGAQYMNLASSGSRTITLLFERQTNNAGTSYDFFYDLDFSVPIKIEENRITITYSQARAVGDAFTLNVYGWYE